MHVYLFEWTKSVFLGYSPHLIQLFAHFILHIYSCLLFK